MRRIASILIVVSLASCKEKAPAIAPEARGAAFFAPTAEKLGVLVAADMKASKETWYQEYLKETGAKDEAELGLKIGQGLLKECAAAFALTEPQESALKSGRFEDAANREKVKIAAGKFGPERPAPDAYRIALAKVNAGDWGKGLELEFVARLLQYQPAKR